MNDNSNGDDAAFDRVRRAVAINLKLAPDAPTAGRAEVPVSLARGAGFVSFVGTGTGPRADWTTPHGEITYGELRAHRDRLSTAGLGSMASVVWHRAQASGTAYAWGATASEAVARLVDGLRELWPDLQAAVGAVGDGPWESQERRTSATGVSIIAPTAGGERSEVVLEAGRAHVEVSVASSGAGWLDRVRRVIGVVPHPLADAFVARHTAAGGPGRHRWLLPHHVWVVAPAERFWPELDRAVLEAWL